MINYPPAPTSVSSDVTSPSALYKQEVVKSISAIILFIVAYLLLISATAAFAFLLLKIGLGIIMLGGHLLIIIAGGGVILIGLLIFFFVIKFIFNSYKTDRSNLIELDEHEQPELFSFIRNITEETQAPFPKKIYISNEVNASVFYDSTFWSMFLPIRKNLLIGLGLVNSVTISEFKAVLAHEFGHFSQKSMKVGSYVYNANRIIHNLLFDNGGFFKTLQTIASVHFILYICMYSVLFIVQGIQYILNAVYRFINKQNMKLSREMEFHADSVAASVAGSKPLVTSLYRLELAESSFNTTLSLCDKLLLEQRQEKNIYPAHHIIMNGIARDNKIMIANGLPQIDQLTLADFDASRVNIQNQWASHPSTQDREEALMKLNIDADIVNDSAWQLFREPNELQEYMTRKLYQQANINDEPRTVDTFVEAKYHDHSSKYKLPEFTKGYWDTKLLPADYSLLNDTRALSDNEIYSQSQLNQARQLAGLDKDINVLEAIENKQIETSSFDFDGCKYSKKDANTIRPRLLQEKAIIEEEIAKTDRQLIQWHAQKATNEGKASHFDQLFQKVLFFQQKQQEYTVIHEDIIKDLTPLFQGANLNMDDARLMVQRVQSKEKNIKQLLEAFLLNEFNHTDLNETSLQTTRQFIESNRIYLSGNQFMENNIRELLDGLNSQGEMLNEFSFTAKRELLEL